MGLIQFAFLNFGPILVFYLANSCFGLQIAVLSSVIWIMAEVSYYLFKKKPISPFFKFSAAITLVFGCVDLFLQRSLLFKYEAALSNAMVGVFFLLSLRGEKPIILQFAEAQGRISKELTPELKYYFKFLTVVWSLYSFVKAGVYIWIASNYSLEQGLIFRGVVGNASFYALLFVSIFGSRQIIFILRKLKMT